ncbi:unnamed protein product [Diplocarpon coronariae]
MDTNTTQHSKKTEKNSRNSQAANQTPQASPIPRGRKASTAPHRTRARELRGSSGLSSRSHQITSSGHQVISHPIADLCITSGQVKTHAKERGWVVTPRTPAAWGQRRRRADSARAREEGSGPRARLLLLVPDEALGRRAAWTRALDCRGGRGCLDQDPPWCSATF